MRACRVLAVVLAASVTGCGTAQQGRVVPVPTSAPASMVATPSTEPAEPASPEAEPTPARSRLTWRMPTTTTRGTRTSDGWEITVYYTAVERFHRGAPTPVTGCPRLECAHGDDDLGEYPAGFVEAVQSEGTGRTSAGRYLNWSHDVGFWLDSAPRSADGTRLIPFVSAAADPEVLPYGTRFAIASCGRQEDGSAPAADVCARLRDAEWKITDEFTPGLGGPKHIDAYIGPETGPGFTDTDWYLSLIRARLAIG